MNSSGVALRAQADVIGNSNVIGFIESKSDSTTCNIRVLGVSEEIFTGLDVTKEYYLSAVTPGLITTAIPTGSGNVVLKMGQPFSDKSF